METKREQEKRLATKSERDIPGVGPLPRKPLVTVKMIGEDGNAFAILGRVGRALKAAGFVKEAADYQKRATAGGYDHLMTVTLQYANPAGGEGECGTCGEACEGSICESCEEDEEREQDEDEGEEDDGN